MKIDKSKENEITANIVCNTLRYDCDTGLIYFKKRSGNKRAGKIAGWIDDMGYIEIGCCGYMYYAHRIAWLLHYGEWPGINVDHINGVRSDNRISNLRLATNKDNCKNRQVHRNGKPVGVYYSDKHNGFVAYVMDGRRKIHIGTYKTIADAVHARKLFSVLYRMEK